MEEILAREEREQHRLDMLLRDAVMSARNVSRDIFERATSKDIVIFEESVHIAKVVTSARAEYESHVIYLEKDAEELADLSQVIEAGFEAAKKLPQYIDAIKIYYKNEEWFAYDYDETKHTITIYIMPESDLELE